LNNWNARGGQWVSAGCPYKSPKKRGEWVRVNLFFYAGTTWTRNALPYKSNSGKSVVHRSISFSAADGRVIDNGDWPTNRRNDSKRNWGLGKG